MGDCPTLSSVYSALNISTTGNCCLWKGAICRNNAVVGLTWQGLNLSEPLPPSLRLLKSLESLSIDSSKFAQFPEIVTALPLLNLTLQSNTMNGQIPQSIGNMASLVQLNLQDNQLSGPLPIEIGRLINLESLDLSGNPFSGQIPQELGQLQKLVQLDFSNTSLIGQVPSTWAQLRLQQCSLNSQVCVPEKTILPSACGQIANCPKPNGSTTSDPGPAQSDGLGVGVIAAIVVGALGFIVVFVIVVLYLRRTKSKAKSPEPVAISPIVTDPSLGIQSPAPFRSPLPFNAPQPESFQQVDNGSHVSLAYQQPYESASNVSYNYPQPAYDIAYQQPIHDNYQPMDHRISFHPHDQKADPRMSYMSTASYKSPYLSGLDQYNYQQAYEPGMYSPVTSEASSGLPEIPLTGNQQMDSFYQQLHALGASKAQLASVMTVLSKNNVDFNKLTTLRDVDLHRLEITDTALQRSVLRAIQQLK